MLAQKQPHIQRVRNSSLVERLCAEDVTGLNTPPKLRVRLYEYCTLREGRRSYIARIAAAMRMFKAIRQMFPGAKHSECGIHTDER